MYRQKEAEIWFIEFFRYLCFRICGNSSVGRAQPCQGWGREFESRFPLWKSATYRNRVADFLFVHGRKTGLKRPFHVSALSIVISSDVCAKITDSSKMKKLFAYSNIVRIFANTRSENMSPKAYTEQEEQLARFAKAMGHPARMAILRFLAGQESCFFGDIHEVLPIAKATVSQHLKELKADGRSIPTGSRWFRWRPVFRWRSSPSG